MIKTLTDQEIILLQLTPLRRAWLVTFVVILLSGCANKAQLVDIQSLEKSATVPYNKVLVVGLFDSFETRSLLERAIVRDIGRGTPGAIAATSLMTTTTPLNAESILAAVKKSGADAVLVTQLIDLTESQTIVKDRNPQTSVKVSPTYYWNVYDVRVTEYMEPQYLEAKGTVLLMTELYQVDGQQRVWGVESKAKIVKDLSRPDYYPFVDSEAQKLVKRLRSEGIIQRAAVKP